MAITIPFPHINFMYISNDPNETLVQKPILEFTSIGPIEQETIG